MIPDLLEKTISEGKKILVYGLGKSGAAAAEYILQFTDKIIGVDRTEQSVRGIKVYTESDPPDLSEVGLVIVSPGVPKIAPLIQTISEKKIPVTGEFELGLLACTIPQIIITGSNGKSTTTALVGALIKDSIVCGNIGTPVVSIIESCKGKKALVVEASSYQLENISHPRPLIAAVLNIAENHLERHGTLENYTSAKFNVFKNQTRSEFGVLNADDPVLMERSKLLGGALCLFGQSERVTESQNYAKIVYNSFEKKDEIEISLGGKKSRFDLSNTKLLGLHNRYNWAAAILMCKLFGADDDQIRIQIPRFVGLAHRLEVIQFEPFIAINDSKSTTVGSTVSAVDSVSRAYPNQNIHLLLGGKMKIGSWKPLAQLLIELRDKISVYCFGGDGGQISSLLTQEGVTTKYLCGSLKDTIEFASGRCHQGDILLLSPGCASFDEFSNFEERGDYFRILLNAHV